MQVRGKAPRRSGRVGRPATSSRPSVGQLPHQGRSIRTGRDLRHELLDLPLRPVGGALQERLPVLRGQVRRQLRDGRQVQPAVGQHAQEEGMLSRGAGGGDAEVGLGLGEVKDLGAVHEHRGRGFAGIEPAPVDLANVGDEGGLVATGLTEQIRQATEQLVVGERCQRVSAFHENNIGRRFATSWDRAAARAMRRTLARRGPARWRRSWRSLRAAHAFFRAGQRRLAKRPPNLVKGKVKKKAKEES